MKTTAASLSLIAAMLVATVYGQTSEILPSMRGGVTVANELDTTGGLTLDLGFGVEYLVVGGGGGGGGAAERAAGGGGGGGVRAGLMVVGSQTYGVTVGAGGAFGPASNSSLVNMAGGNGGNSTFGLITALGGGEPRGRSHGRRFRWWRLFF